MKMILKLAIFLIFTALFDCALAASDKVVCYVGSWSVYTEGDGMFSMSDIPPTICTHLIYAFTGLTEDGDLKILDPFADLTDGGGKGGYQKVVNLKQSAPDLKVMIAMGGWNEDPAKISRAFSNPQIRSNFVRNSVKFLKQHGFDGLDLDWEYPTERGGQPSDKQNFSELIKELRAAFNQHGFLLSAAVAAPESRASKCYDIPQLGKYLDFINLMTYDFHQAPSEVTGHNSPTYLSSDDRRKGNNGFSVEASIRAWINLGAPPKKLVVGIPAYGSSFTVSNETPSPTVRSINAGTAGKYSKQAGTLAYNEICEMEKLGGTVNWDDESKVPYLTKGDQWVSYDNEKSIKIKTNLIKEFNLGGGMVWSLEKDDFRGNCGKGKYPLVNAIKNGLKK